MLMTIVTVLLVIVEVFCSILLVFAVLLQRSKSPGAAAGLAFGAGMGESLFGAQAGNVLTRATTILLAIFLATTTLLAVLGARGHREQGSVTDRIDVPTAPMPVPGSMAPMATPMPETVGELPGMPATEPMTMDSTPAAAPIAETPAPETAAPAVQPEDE